MTDFGRFANPFAQQRVSLGPGMRVVTARSSGTILGCDRVAGPQMLCSHWRVRLDGSSSGLDPVLPVEELLPQPKRMRLRGNAALVAARGGARVWVFNDQRGWILGGSGALKHMERFAALGDVPATYGVE